MSRVWRNSWTCDNGVLVFFVFFLFFFSFEICQYINKEDTVKKKYKW